VWKKGKTTLVPLIISVLCIDKGVEQVLFLGGVHLENFCLFYLLRFDFIVIKFLST